MCMLAFASWHLHLDMHRSGRTVADLHLSMCMLQCRSKEQGERLQRQVLQYLVKQQAHPAMISAVASNLADMLWAQDKFEEAERVLEQARQVAPAFPHAGSASLPCSLPALSWPCHLKPNIKPTIRLGSALNYVFVRFCDTVVSSAELQAV